MPFSFGNVQKLVDLAFKCLIIPGIVISEGKNSDARNELRKITVSDFVNLNGLEYKYYQDEGWDPVELTP